MMGALLGIYLILILQKKNTSFLMFHSAKISFQCGIDFFTL